MTTPRRPRIHPVRGGSRFEQVVRRGVLAIALLVVLVACGWPSAQASCASARTFNSNYHYLSPIFYNGSLVADFWALGLGDPTPGIGIDDGTLDSYNFVSYYGLYGSWNQPGIDGCIDDAGATPAFDGDECMAVTISQQNGGVGYVSALTAKATPGSYPEFDFTPVTSYYIVQSPILRPTPRLAAPSGTQVDLTLDVGPGQPSGIEFDPDCGGIITGYRLAAQEFPAGAAPPTDVAFDAGWTEVTPTLEFGVSADVTLDCETGNDVYLATWIQFEDGYSAAHVSRPGAAVRTSTDSDLDGTADACDSCTDTDGDGFGDPDLLSNACPTDNCPAEFNPGQEDADLDGAGDLCDLCQGEADSRPRLVADLGANSELILAGWQLNAAAGRAVFAAFKETAAFELFSVPLSGGPAVRLNPPFADGRNIFDFQTSPGLARVVYVADQDNDEVLELYSVPDAGGPSIKLNLPLVDGGDVLPPGTTPVAFSSKKAFAIAPDGSRVVYRADQEIDESFELFSVSMFGGPAIKLNGTLFSSAADVLEFAVSADGSRVVYRAPQESGFNELYSVPIVGGWPVRLSPAIAGTVFNFAISPDGSTVAFEQRLDLTTQDDGLFAVSILGGPAAQLNTSAENILSYGFSPDSSRLVYRAAPDGVNRQDLYSVPVTGGFPVRLNEPPGPGGSVYGFEISADSSTVVFRSDQETPNVLELFAVSITGGSAKKINGEIVNPNGDVGTFRIAPDDTTVLYRADQDTDHVDELFAVPITGQQPALRLNVPLGLGRDVQSDFRITPDATTVVYRVGDGITGVTGTIVDVLYSVPITGGSSTRLSDPGSAGAVERFDLPGDGTEVVFQATPGLHRTPVIRGRDVDLDGAVDQCDSCTDTDGDGFGDRGYSGNNCAPDNCPGAVNGSQLDTDGDGAGDACDCAPADPAIRAPEPVPGLSLARVGNATARLSWAPAVGADRYSITRGRLSELEPGRYGACLVAGLTVLTRDDPDPAPSGDGWIYLVRGESQLCGAGTLGYGTDDGERVNESAGACP